MITQARAHANIAVVKYWGKRDEALVLPHTGSISLALSPLTTLTTVELLQGPGADEVRLDGAPASPKEAARVSKFLDRAAEAGGLAGRPRARVVSKNDFPTAAGLASSASGFAALAVAAADALELPATVDRSALARLGSGSAARSVPGGWAEWRRGERADGADSVAVALAPASHWDVRLVVALAPAGRKAVGSREAMARSVATSPYYAAWVAGAAADLASARAAIAARDLLFLGETAEHSFQKMHALAHTSRPPVVFFEPATLAALRAVEKLRAEGVPVYATVDAGPHLVAICAAADSLRVEKALAAAPGVARTIVASPAGGAERVA